MNITLNTTNIFNEMRLKSHLEVQDIKDPEARDNARAGITKTDEINRCILDALGQLERRCLRFLTETIVQDASDAGSLPNSYVFDLNLSERRAANKIPALTAVMHDYAVQHALARYYETVHQAELSAAHAKSAEGYGIQIDELLYHKQPPRV